MKAGTLLERIAEVISRYRMFRPGDRAAVAVSGGADSVALLDILCRLAPRFNLKLEVVHFNHKLRGEESEADARFVAGLARDYGLGFTVREADVRAMARASRENLEQTARRARLAFFTELVAGGRADRVALGHTGSDQAETVLFRLLRGAGIAGLAAIWPVTAEGLVRPLIELTRDEVRRYVAGRGLAWREDASNAQMVLARNRIRQDLLPRLEREWNPELVPALGRLARLAQAEERYWREEIGRLAARELVCREGAVLVRCSRVRELPEAAALRLMRRAVELAKGDLRRLEFEHVERLLGLASAPQGTGSVALPDLCAERSFDWLRLARRQATEGQTAYEIALEVPGSAVLPGSGRWLRLEIVEWPEGYPGGGEGYNTDGGDDLDICVAAGGLQLRNWRPGDAFHRAGRPGTEKLKDLFQRARIPVWERLLWPIITCRGRIAWVRRFGVAEEFRVRTGARQSVRLRENGEGSG